MKQKITTLFAIAAIAFVAHSCKKKEPAPKPAPTPETVVTVEDSITVDSTSVPLETYYPEETKAHAVIAKGSKIHITRKTKDKKITKHEATVHSGQTFTDKNNNVVGGYVVAVTKEQDTVKVHYTASDLNVTPEKQNARKFKGIVEIDKHKYNFETPLTITKEAGGIGVDGNIDLVGEGEQVQQSGPTTETETTKKGDPTQVKIKALHNGETEVKLKDLKTDKKEKVFYDAHGNFLKSKGSLK